MLHDGPSSDNHFLAGGAVQPAADAPSGGALQPAADAPPNGFASAVGNVPETIQAGHAPRTDSYLASAEPPMPPLRRMHEIVAADPRAQAKFFLLMSELHYRHIIGVERLHIGRVTLARPRRPLHDGIAASLQPCVTPGTIDLQAPLEAQGRGFTHGHGKGHSILGPNLKWLREAVSTGFTPAVRRVRDAILSMAATVQYDSARESGRQMGVDLRAEPFSARQLRQS